jgi:hypothetical protein
MEPYRIDPEWGSLAGPLQRMLEKQNGMATPVVDRLQRVVLEKLEKAAIPGRKNEDWKYTGLRELLKTKFTSLKQSFLLILRISPRSRRSNSMHIVSFL